MDLVLNAIGRWRRCSAMTHALRKGTAAFKKCLLVALQEACVRPTGAISITMTQRQRTRMYAFRRCGNGGWEAFRLVTTFGRHLGRKLDLGLPPLISDLLASALKEKHPQPPQSHS